MQNTWKNGKRYCNKHGIELKHGLKKGYPVKIYRKGYFKNLYGYYFHCEDCLRELKNDFYGKSLFAEDDLNAVQETRNI